MDCATLLRSAKRIVYNNVNFWTIESTISFIVFPRFAVFIQGRLQLAFSLIPLLITSHRTVRPCREEYIPLEPKQPIDMIKELYASKNLLLYLVPSAENMSIVLLKSPHSSQARERTADLISVKHSEICVSHWQFLIGMSHISEHETVAWAVHWLQTKCLTVSQLTLTQMLMLVLMSL